MMTMVVMLGVLVLLFGLVRDTKTWRWIAPAAPPDGGDAAAKLPAVAVPEVERSGPTDLDADERDAGAKS